MNILQFKTANECPNQYDDLTTELSFYGLSPRDWSISKEQGLAYRIENKEEPTFFFRGQITVLEGKRKWQAIRLAGI